MTLYQLHRQIARAKQRSWTRSTAGLWDGTTDMAAVVAIEELRQQDKDPT